MLIDTHAHIYVDQFEVDFQQVINRARESGLSKILMPNIDTETIDQVILRANQYPVMCKPMVGLHPCSITEEWSKDLDKLEPYLTYKNIIAVGEIGIDLYWDKTYHKEQEKAIKHQIQWALDLDLPIVIHSRAAIDYTIKIVQSMQTGNLRGVFHCFDQSSEHAKRILDIGFYLGIGGIITYKKNELLRETLTNIPISKIILETDSPYLPPVPYRGKRNESSYLPIIANKLSEIKNLSFTEVCEKTSKNAIELFDLHADE